MTFENLDKSSSRAKIADKVKPYAGVYLIVNLINDSLTNSLILFL